MGLNIVSLYTLNSCKEYDFARGAGGKYLQFMFANYDDNQKFTGESWEGIVSFQDIFEFLKSKNLLNARKETNNE